MPTPVHSPGQTPTPSALRCLPSTPHLPVYIAMCSLLWLSCFLWSPPSHISEGSAIRGAVRASEGADLLALLSRRASAAISMLVCIRDGAVRSDARWSIPGGCQSALGGRGCGCGVRDATIGSLKSEHVVCEPVDLDYGLRLLLVLALGFRRLRHLHVRLCGLGLCLLDLGLGLGLQLYLPYQRNTTQQSQERG